MGNDIGSGLSFKAVCFDFRSTNVGSSVIGTRSTKDKKNELASLTVVQKFSKASQTTSEKPKTKTLSNL